MRLPAGTKLYTHPARQAVSVPGDEYIRALQDAFDIIQADANTEENYASLCRIGSVLAKFNATPTKTDEPCEWKQNDDGGWDGSCGIEFYLEEDTPPENGIKFCPECGKPCVAIEPTEEQDDE